MSQEFYFEAKHKNGTKFSIASYSRSNMMYQVWEEVGVPSYSEARVITPSVINEAINAARVMRESRNESRTHTKEMIEDLKDLRRGASGEDFEEVWDRLLSCKEVVRELSHDIEELDKVIYELYTWRDMIEYENGEDWTFYGSIEGYLPGEGEED